MGKQADRKRREAAKIVADGAAAFMEGKPREACPFHSRVELRQLWIHGYEQAQMGLAAAPRASYHF